MTSVRNLNAVSIEGAEGKYRPLVELGQGGTADVFLAVACGPSGFSKLVVLKTLRAGCAQDPEFRRMFLNEARLSARLNHANIVQTNEVFEEDGRPIIVMEYLDGEPLSNILSAGRARLPLAVHLQIIVHALSGLHHAHELEDFDGAKLNVVHRDMTPHNLFVTFEGHVKLLDFGIAKLDRSDHTTETGVIKGKFRYMAPEQMEGGALDRRADLYAVGVMIWEAATGERMWKDMSDAVIMNSVLNGEIPSPRSVSPAVSAELERICMKALATEREDRYETAAQLAADLEAVIDDLGTKVTSRAIGRAIAGLFESERAARKKAIEAQLKKVNAISWADHLSPDEDDRSATGIHAVHANRARVSPLSRMNWRGVLVGIGVACSFVLVSLLKGAAKQDAPAAAPSAAYLPSAPATRAVEAARPELVDVRVSASPAEARLFLDDQALAMNPFTARMTKDSSLHRVRAEARARRRERERRARQGCEHRVHSGAR